jgi:hypothetical protein
MSDVMMVKCTGGPYAGQVFNRFPTDTLLVALVRTPQGRTIMVWDEDDFEDHQDLLGFYVLDTLSATLLWQDYVPDVDDLEEAA